MNKHTTDNKPYMIYSYKMMRYLDDLGFKFFAYKPDNKGTGKIIFIYDNTPELVEAVQNYKKK